MGGIISRPNTVLAITVIITLLLPAVGFLLLPPYTEQIYARSFEIADMVWSNDGQKMIIPDSDEFRLWDLEEERITSIASYYMPLSKYFHADWSPDDSAIAFTGRQGIYLYNSAELSSPMVWINQTMNNSLDHVLDGYSFIYDLDWHPTQDLFITLHSNQRLLVLWDGTTLQPLQELLHNQIYADSARWSPDGTQVVIGHDAGFTLLDFEVGQLINANTMTNFRFASQEVQWSPDGSQLLLYSTQEADAIRIFDLATEEIVYRLDVDYPVQVEWDRTGQHLGYVNSEGLTVVEIESSKSIWTLSIDTGSIALAFNPSMPLLAYVEYSNGEWDRVFLLHLDRKTMYTLFQVSLTGFWIGGVVILVTAGVQIYQRRKSVGR